MKVYVVRELKTREYLTETRDFINDLRQAELFFDYDCAKSFSPYGCEVVEVQLMETKDITDYTKQVINNTFDKINSEYAKRLSAFMGTKISVSTAICKLDEVLDQIQGETK